MSGPRVPTTSALAELVGRKLPGGCDDCDAYQSVAQAGPDLYVLTVHHDATCPWVNGGGPDVA